MGGEGGRREFGEKQVFGGRIVEERGGGTGRARPFFKNAMKLLLLAGLVFLPWVGRSEEAADWRQFRGPHGQGLAVGGAMPVDLRVDGARWKVAVSPGHASPVVVGGRLFLAVWEGGGAHMVCLDAATGGERWRARVPGAAAGEVHPTGSAVAATPVSDGKRVIGYFPGFGLIAWDLDGKELWRHPLEVPFVVNGSGTSPVLAEGKCVLCVDQQGGKSYLIALDPSDGRTLWRTERPGAVSNYTTPVLWRRGARVDLVVSGNLQATGYDLADGAARWMVGGLEAVSVCPSPVVGEGALYLMSRSLGGGAALPAQMEALLLAADADGDGRLSRAEAVPLQKDGGFDFFDRDRDGWVGKEEVAACVAYLRRADYGLFGVRDPEGAAGDLSESHLLWRHQRGIAKVTSPVLVGGNLVVVQEGGMVTVTEAASGRVVWEKERLGPEGAGDYFASPISDGRRICFCSLRGVVTIAEVEEGVKVRAQVKLDSAIAATPALVGKRLYVRTRDYLWAFGE